MLQTCFPAKVFLLAIVLLVSACAGYPQLGPDDDPNCGDRNRTARIEFGSNIFRQGATVSVKAVRDNSPAGQVDLVGHCSSGWGVHGAAKLANKNRELIINADAPVNSKITVSYHAGSQPISQTVSVIARDAVVLTGSRMQTGIQGCTIATKIGELEFTADNVFSVTFSPFETYRDYWGNYSFDPSSGALVMKVLGGNMVPAGLKLDGRAHFENDHLILEDMYLGGPRGGQEDEPIIENDQIVGWRKADKAICRYTF